MHAGIRNIFFIIILTLNSLHGQQYLRPYMLPVEDGLPANNVTNIHIDPQGFLWAGTNNGLSRFNGYSFKPFFTSATGNGYPGIQFTRKIRTDEHGNLWVLNAGGFNIISSKNGEITHYPSAIFDSSFRSGSSLVDLYPSHNGTTWILSDKSLTRFNSEKGFTTYPLPDDLLKNGMVPTALVADKRGNIWIGTTNGLLLFSENQAMFKEIVGVNDHDLLSHNEIKCLYLDDNDFLWAGTRLGLNHIDPIEYEFYSYYPSGNRKAEPLNNIVQICGTENGGLVLATQGGIVGFDPMSQDFMSIFSAADTSIWSVAVDFTGNIWAGTDLGILKLRKSKVLFRNFNSRTPGLRLAGDNVSTLMVHKENNKLFIGYRQNGFSLVDTWLVKGSHFNTLDGSAVTGFYHFTNQEYLIVSQHEIEIFSSAAQRTSIRSLYPFIKRELLQYAVLNCLFYDGANSIWIGTNDGIQVVRIDSARHYEKKILKFQNQQEALGTVYDIEMDAAGNLWMGTDNGLIYYNPERGNFNRLTPYDINLLNTEHKAVYSIVPENKGVYWLGTSSGVFRFDLSNREFTAVTNNPEIMNAPVKALDVDRNGNIWMCTESGLFNYVKATNVLNRYDIMEGLLNDSWHTVSAGHSGYVYSGGPRGISAIDISAVADSVGVPGIAITSIRYLDNRPEAQDLYFHPPDTIMIKWSRRPLQIEFAILDLSRPEYNQYRYSLVKTRDKTVWKPLGNRNSVIIDRLPPGKYRFSVSGAGSDKTWNNSGESIVVIVGAPYWRSKIGLGLIVTIGIVLVFLFFRFWVRQFFNLSRENQEREMFARQIMLQKEELTLKNKAITDSINYAKRIQTAMLPPYKLFKSIFPSSFILFMPKDIVSGDFYWINKVGNKIFVAAVDCTGHGVPGAFMSIIGFELFRKITNIEGLTRPSDILNRLNDDFHEIFKDVDNVVLRDGMDVAFCSIDKKDMILEFAGAFNPLYLIRDNKIMEVKGDRFAIGLDETNFREQTFKNHIIPIQTGDIIYVFSDGFADQFGGPDGKKYKYRRFRHLLLNLHQLPMEKQHEILENNVLEWRGEQEQVDDILVIGIKIDF